VCICFIPIGKQQFAFTKGKAGKMQGMRNDTCEKVHFNILLKRVLITELIYFKRIH